MILQTAHLIPNQVWQRFKGTKNSGLTLFISVCFFFFFFFFFFFENLVGLDTQEFFFLFFFRFVLFFVFTSPFFSQLIKQFLRQEGPHVTEVPTVILT